MSKHKAMYDWVSEFNTENGLTFEAIEMYPNMRALVPVYGEYKVKSDVIGNDYMEYMFAFVGVQSLSQYADSENNIGNMEMFDLFNDWLREKQKQKQFPDFGEKCSEYEIVPLNNMANMATVDESGNAKYMLMAKVSYKQSNE